MTKQQKGIGQEVEAWSRPMSLGEEGGVHLVKDFQLRHDLFLFFLRGIKCYHLYCHYHL